MSEEVDAQGVWLATEGFTQVASLRAAGLTWMLWGLALPLAAAALSQASELSVDMDEAIRFRLEGGWGVIGSVVVLAWAAVVTGFIWNAFAMRPDTRLRPAVSLAVFGLILPVLASALWFLAFVVGVVAPERSPEDHWVAVERAFVFVPSPLIVTGLWLGAASFGPWLGPRRRFTLSVGTACLVAGLMLNALRLLDVVLNEVVRTGSVLAVLGGVGAYLFLRG